MLFVLVVDNMHNLFLGTAKSMFQLWMETDLLTKDKLGRLPHKIAPNYGRYRALQWKNWVIIYPTYALHGLLSDEHLNCWHAFVMACCLLTVPVLTHLDLNKADML